MNVLCGKDTKAGILCLQNHRTQYEGSEGGPVAWLLTDRFMSEVVFIC